MDQAPQLLKAIIAEQLGVDRDKVVSGAHFMKDLGADSLDAVELVMLLEENFDVEISDADAEKLLTVGDVIAYLEKHAAKAE